MAELHKLSTSSTILRSSRARVAIGVIVVSACAPSCAGTAMPTPEAPAPHLRGAVVARPASAERARDDSMNQVLDPSAKSNVALEGILAFADAHSPVLLVARSTRSRAEAARVAASMLLPANPELSVAAGPRYGASGRGIDVDISLTQQIQIAGERGMRIDAADRYRELTDAEIEQVRWAVHCDVHAAFHRALVERDRAQLAERVVSFQRSVLGVVERQIAAGETAPLTLRLAQAEVAQAEQVLVSAEQSLFASRIRLAQLSGWPITSPPMPTGAVDSPRDPPPLDRLGAIARERLPSLRVGYARIREASARVEAKKIAAATAVDFDRKLDEPLAPNRLPDAPEPKAAPMSAPLPCWTSTRPMMASADTTCRTTIRLNNTFIIIPFQG